MTDDLALIEPFVLTAKCLVGKLRCLKKVLKQFDDVSVRKVSPTIVRSAPWAFKWIRILYACWKAKTPYDESRYLQALQSKTFSASSS